MAVSVQVPSQLHVFGENKSAVFPRQCLFVFLKYLKNINIRYKDDSFLHTNWEKHLYVSFFMYFEDGPIIKDIFGCLWVYS